MSTAIGTNSRANERHHGGVHSDAVDIWWARLGDADDTFRSLFDATEQGRYAAYRRPADAARFLLGATMVRVLGARHLALPVDRVAVDRSCATCGRQHGRVRLPGTQLEVSISHSGDLVGVAAHLGAPVGLDVERHAGRLEVDVLCRHVLAPAEGTRLATFPEADRTAGLLRYWTRKEAIVKCTGDGLRTELTTVVVSAPDEPAALVSWAGRPDAVSNLRLYDLPTRDAHLAAVAVWRRQPVSIREHPASELLAALG
jgi:4'-phosphopantetheinyl transferase